MKNITKAIMCLGLLSSGELALADNIPLKGSTTCYMVQNDKLQKKANCTYKGNANYYSSGALHEGIFIVKGVNKPVKVSLNFDFSGNEDQYALNGKDSIFFSRSKSTFKRVSNQEEEQLLNKEDGMKQLLSCVKDENSKQEFCFDADKFGSL